MANGMFRLWWGKDIASTTARFATLKTVSASILNLLRGRRHEKPENILLRRPDQDQKRPGIMRIAGSMLRLFESGLYVKDWNFENDKYNHSS